jgi:hypothetical protein
LNKSCPILSNVLRGGALTTAGKAVDAAATAGFGSAEPMISEPALDNRLGAAPARVSSPIERGAGETGTAFESTELACQTMLDTQIGFENIKRTFLAAHADGTRYQGPRI